MNVVTHDAYSMLTIYCPTHNSEVLVGPRRIRHLANTPQGVELVVECYCGRRVDVLACRHARAGAQAVAA